MSVATNIPIEKLRRRPDARLVDRDTVAALATSIAEIGILNPLIVRSKRISVNSFEEDGFEIIAGVHRYEAASRAGLLEVPCVVVTHDDLRAELVMIDENLCRADLSPAQEAASIARRKVIYETLHPETKAEAFKGNRHTGSLASESSAFAKATAETTGKSRRSVEVAAARGKALGDDLNAIAGTSLDKGAELDALAKMPSSERASLIGRAKSGENVSARTPRIAPEHRLALSSDDAVRKQFTAIMNAWDRACEEARQMAREAIDQPIMDARYGSAA